MGAILALLAACSAQPAAPDASIDHDQQLSEAAAMLDANSVSPAAILHNDADEDEDGQ